MRLQTGFERVGYQLATSDEAERPTRSLLEVYPHPALLLLLGLPERLPYKVSKSRRYWPTPSRDERRVRLLTNQHRVLEGLRESIDGIDLPLPEPEPGGSLASLKRYEDALDALVCAWVGTRYLDGKAKAYNRGDLTAAIWVPE